MHIAAVLPLIFTVIGHTQAQAPTSTVLSFFLLDTDVQNLEASVIGVESATTTYVVTCPTGIDASDCGYNFNPPMRVSQAANFAGGDVTVAGGLSMTWHCDITSSTVAATCTQSQGGAGVVSSGVFSATMSGTDIEYFPVTVTAGLDKLTTNGGVTDTTANPMQTSAGSAGPSQTNTSSGSQNTAATSSNGAPKPTTTGNAAGRVRSGSSLLAIVAGLLEMLL